jgi:hypothetical protein
LGAGLPPPGDGFGCSATERGAVHALASDEQQLPAEQRLAAQEDPHIRVVPRQDVATVERASGVRKVAGDAVGDQVVAHDSSSVAPARSMWKVALKIVLTLVAAVVGAFVVLYLLIWLFSDG